MSDPSRTGSGESDSQSSFYPTPPGGVIEPAEPRFAPSEFKGEVGKLGRYRVLKKLGQGGMGAVYLGFDAALDRKIALKVMLPAQAANTESRARFLREAKLAAKVQNDHVVIIHAVDEEDGTPFISMEYLRGTPLDQFLKTKGDLTLSQAVRVVRETAIGLVAAHDLGLIHRDIKPANLWLEAPKGRVKILDFGLARPTDDDAHLTSSTTPVGTPAYMSPEQGRGLKVDHRTDLFSLGVLLYRLTTGKRPFTGENGTAVQISAAMDTPVPPRELNPQIPEGLEAVINKLLAKNPANRLQTAQEVVNALAGLEQSRSGSGVLPTIVAMPIAPITVEAQISSVWDGIDDSKSAPVLLEPQRPTRERPEREKPVRSASKSPLWLVAGCVLLALLALVAVGVVVWPKKPEITVKEPDKSPTPDKKEPGKPPTEKKQPPKVTPVVISPERKATEGMLDCGGRVNVDNEMGVMKDGKVTLISRDRNSGLPTAEFRLTGIFLQKCEISNNDFAQLKDCLDLMYLYLEHTQVTNEWLAIFQNRTNVRDLFLAHTKVSDAGLAHFKNCKNMVNLNLASTTVTDKGLANFDGCTTVRMLYLNKTGTTDLGLSYFRDCAGLDFLNLTSTKVSDASLPQLKSYQRLKNLHLDDTQVTPKGLEELRIALPNCTITPEPKK